jgi:hypothetical protein
MPTVVAVTMLSREESQSRPIVKESRSPFFTATPPTMLVGGAPIKPGLTYAYLLMVIDAGGKAIPIIQPITLPNGASF